MGLRPASALWFELLVVREDLTRALEILARSRRVELQTHSETGADGFLNEARPLLEAFEEQRQKFSRYWPAPLADSSRARREPKAMLRAAMRSLQEWVAQAGDTVAALQASEQAYSELDLLKQVFEIPYAKLPDLELIRDAGPMLRSALYLLAGEEWPESQPASVITQQLRAGRKHFLLAVGTVGEMASFEQQLVAGKARRIALPEWLPREPAQVREAVRQRAEELTSEIAELRAKLDLLNKRHELAGALADVSLVSWYVRHVPELAGTDNFAWITGWTSAQSGDELLAMLADQEVRGLLRTSEPPPGIQPPSLFQNPPWMRPFEFFTGLMGVPAAGEADPTMVVAIVGPLMFGYMFGDVGHGAVLMLAGLILCRRFPALKLLIAGGALSILFGFLHGSVFAREDLLPALWLHPLENPVLILIVPLAGGAVLLLMGMTLDAVQQFWQKRFITWLKTDAALVLCYLTLLGAFFDVRLLWGTLAAALWYVSGQLQLAADHYLGVLAAALTELAETLLQLVVNTVSFVRVGAFALAHAGLAAAVVGVAEATGSATGALLVLVLGNALIIGLEGLIVGIQTTRLVLFEFFIRFLHAGGRPFRPLAVPDSSATLHKG